MIIPVGYAQVNLRYTGVGLPTGAEMTFGVNNGPEASAVALAETIEAAIITAGFGASMFEDAVLTTIHVKLGPNATGQFVDHGTNIAGTEADTPVPPNVSVLLKKNTPVGGRKGQGRMFMPAIPENDISADGLVGSGKITDITAQCSTLLSELSGGDIGMVVLHNDSTSPYSVTSLVPQVRAATQRRRLRR